VRQKSGPEKQPAEDAIKDIRRATRRHFSSEEKIRVVLEGLRGEESIAELCRREGIASSMYYGWSKEFLEAGKRRLAGDTARAATSDEVKDLRGGGNPACYRSPRSRKSEQKGLRRAAVRMATGFLDQRSQRRLC
jgi:transposase